MVKLKKRYVGFKTYVEAHKHAMQNNHKHASFGWNKKHKHFYEY